MPHASDPDAGVPFDLEARVADVLRTFASYEGEVQDRFRRWYQVRIRPYTTLDNVVDGVVLALIDIDALKHSQQEAEAARAQAEALLRVTRDPTLVLDKDLRVRTVNDAYCRTFCVEAGAVEGRLLGELGDGEWQLPRLSQLLDDVVARNGSFRDLEVTKAFPNVGTRTLQLSARRVETGARRPRLIRLTIQDLTEQRRLEASLRSDAQRLRALTSVLTLFTWSMNPNGELADAQPRWEFFTGQNALECRGPGWADALHPDDRERYLSQWAEARRGHDAFRCDVRVWNARERYWQPVTAHAAPLFDDAGNVAEWSGAFVARLDPAEGRTARRVGAPSPGGRTRRITTRRAGRGGSSKPS
jgi:PAS domain-containing protein